MGEKIQKKNLTQWSPSSSECYTEKQKQRKAEQRAGVKLIMKMETATPQICFTQKAHFIRDVNWNTHADFRIFVSLHLSCPPAKKRCCFLAFCTWQLSAPLSLIKHIFSHPSSSLSYNVVNLWRVHSRVSRIWVFALLRATGWTTLDGSKTMLAQSLSSVLNSKN